MHVSRIVVPLRRTYTHTQTRREMRSRPTERDLLRILRDLTKDKLYASCERAGTTRGTYCWWLTFGKQQHNTLLAWRRTGRLLMTLLSPFQTVSRHRAHAKGGENGAAIKVDCAPRPQSGTTGPQFSVLLGVSAFFPIRFAYPRGSARRIAPEQITQFAINFKNSLAIPHSHRRGGGFLAFLVKGILSRIGRRCHRECL